ncbi:hypothetical protein BJY00DRAFT_286490 [Aspergillus carlsbadensis]|nr:hypothetical protein BJY00DRAFT_286490 [Aspergillus carlsbadensis]
MLFPFFLLKTSNVLSLTSGCLFQQPHSGLWISTISTVCRIIHLQLTSTLQRALP